jgi:hypothetical protein
MIRLLAGAGAEPSPAGACIEQQIEKYQRTSCQDHGSGGKGGPTNSGLTSQTRRHLVSLLI